VLVVTHLAQVARSPTATCVVSRRGDGRSPSSGVHLLDARAGSRELARMLGGVEDSVPPASRGGLLTLADRSARLTQT
jgi:DNA repair ATPase RecN